MYTYSPASKCSPALPHQPSRPPRHDQYETSGLRAVFPAVASPPSGLPKAGGAPSAFTASS
ncbi:MAG: hypothetical protein QE493_08125 [Verrucomicrobiae bacterium]|nr:hypothetical protein [Verrucomicrobiae bacterium]